jgi:AcrR family transcriptional regulator
MRETRRRELASALIRVLAAHGQAGATIAAVAAEAGAPQGIVHHYFVDKQDLYGAALDLLVTRFRGRLRAASDDATRLEAYGDAALALDSNADVEAARAWVGLFAEALADPALFQRLRRLLDTEVVAIQHRAGDRLSTQDASAVLAFVVGALVFGAFAPRRAAGFAAPSLRRLIGALGGP